MNEKPNSIMVFLKEIEMNVDKNRPKSDDELFELVEHKALELNLPLNMAKAFVKFYCFGLTNGLAIAYNYPKRRNSID